MVLLARKIGYLLCGGLVSMALLTAPLVGQDITNSMTPTLTLESTAEASPSPDFSATPSPTVEIFATVTFDANTILPTHTSLATETPIAATILLHTVSGYVYYQNSSHDQHSQIEIEIFTDSREFVASALTDAAGVYQVAVPLAMPFWIVADAPLHRENAVRVLPGEALPVLVLLGGDLNDDDCVTLADLQLFGEQTIASDINQDEQITIADVAILTGNLQPACEIFARTLPPTATTTSTFTPENTLTPAPTLAVNMTTTVSPVTNIPDTAVFTETPLVMPPTDTASPTATVTESVPTETAPAVPTVESTPEISGG